MYANIVSGGGTIVLGDPRGVVKQGNIRVGTSASALSEIVDAGDIIVVAGNHENQTIAVEHGASCLIVLRCSNCSGRH